VGDLFAEFGVRQFHLVDLRHSDKDFDGWSIDKKIQLTDELQHVANETLESGVTAFLRGETYQKHYCSLDWPRKALRDTKYCILFRAWVPSRVVLEFADASSGGMRLSDHAARSMI
jgi:hypothetical protein